MNKLISEELKKLTDTELANMIIDFNINDKMLMKSENGLSNWNLIKLECVRRFMKTITL